MNYENNFDATGALCMPAHLFLGTYQHKWHNATFIKRAAIVGLVLATGQDEKSFALFDEFEELVELRQNRRDGAINEACRSMEREVLKLYGAGRIVHFREPFLETTVMHGNIHARLEMNDESGVMSWVCA